MINDGATDSYAHCSGAEALVSHAFRECINTIIVVTINMKPTRQLLGLCVCASFDFRH